MELLGVVLTNAVVVGVLVLALALGTGVAFCVITSSVLFGFLFLVSFIQAGSCWSSSLWNLRACHGVVCLGSLGVWVLVSYLQAEKYEVQSTVGREGSFHLRLICITELFCKAF
jgi:hypothetical protein